MMLDEFPALGRLDFFETSLAFLAGYGVRAFLIAQSLNQIEKAYGDHNAILDNCHVRVAFATNDERTAKRISDALGTATEQRAMRNYAGHRLAPWLAHVMVSRQETARALLTPGEVMQLPPTDELVLLAGTPPIRASKLRYLRRQQFHGSRILPAARRSPSGDYADRPVSRLDDWTGIVRGVDARLGAATVEDGDQRRCWRQVWNRPGEPRSGNRPSAGARSDNGRPARPRQLTTTMSQSDQARAWIRREALGTARIVYAIDEGVDGRRRVSARRSAAGPVTMSSEKIRHQLFLPKPVSDRLEALAAKPGASKSAILTDAVTAWLNRRGASELEDRFGIRLDRMTDGNRSGWNATAIFSSKRWRCSSAMNSRSKRRSPKTIRRAAPSPPSGSMRSSRRSDGKSLPDAERLPLEASPARRRPGNDRRGFRRPSAGHAAHRNGTGDRRGTRRCRG